MPTIRINTADSLRRGPSRAPAGPYPGGPPGGPVGAAGGDAPSMSYDKNTPPTEVRFRPNPRTLAWFSSATSEVQDQSLESFYMTTPYSELNDKDLLGCIEYFRDRRRKATEQKRKRTVRKKEAHLADAALGIRGSSINKIIKSGDSTALNDFVRDTMVKKMRDQGLAESEIETRLAQLAAMQAQA